MLKSAGIFFLARLAAALFGLLAVVVYTRVVPPDEFGVFTLISATAMAVFAIGFQWIRASVLRFVPGESEYVSPTLGASVRAFLLVASLVVVATCVLMATDAFGIGARLVMLAGLVALSYAATELVLAVLQARKRTRHYAVITVVRAAGAVVCGATLALVGMGAEGLLIGMLAGNLIPAVAIVVTRAGEIARYRSIAGDLAAIARFGLPLGLVGIGGIVIALSDRYMLAHLIGTHAAGVYGAPYELAQRSLNMVMLSAFLASSPHVFGRYEREGVEAAREAIMAQAKLGLLTALPLATVMAAGAPLVAAILLGEAFQESARTVLPWIAAATLLQGAQAFHVAYGFTLPHRTGANVVVVGVGAVLNIALNFLLIPAWGIIGAAIATIASYALVLVVSLIVTRRWIALPWPVRDSVKVVAACLLAAPVIAYGASLDDMVHGFLVAGAGCGVGCVALLAFDACEARSMLTSVLGRLLR